MGISYELAFEADYPCKKKDCRPYCEQDYCDIKNHVLLEQKIGWLLL